MGGIVIIGGIMPIMRIHIIIMSIMFIPILLTSFSDRVAVSWLHRAVGLVERSVQGR